jgi:hypothetical protein
MDENEPGSGHGSITNVSPLGYGRFVLEWSDQSDDKSVSPLGRSGKTYCLLYATPIITTIVESTSEMQADERSTKAAQIDPSR